MPAWWPSGSRSWRSPGPRTPGVAAPQPKKEAPPRSPTGRHAAKAEGHDLGRRGGASSSPARRRSEEAATDSMTLGGAPRTYQRWSALGPCPVRHAGGREYGSRRKPSTSGSSTAPAPPYLDSRTHPPEPPLERRPLSDAPHQERPRFDDKRFSSTTGPRVPERGESRLHATAGWRRRTERFPGRRRLHVTSCSPSGRGAGRPCARPPVEVAAAGHREGDKVSRPCAQDRRGSSLAMGEPPANGARLLQDYPRKLSGMRSPPKARARDASNRKKMPQ